MRDLYEIGNFLDPETGNFFNIIYDGGGDKGFWKGY